MEGTTGGHWAYVSLMAEEREVMSVRDFIGDPHAITTFLFSPWSTRWVHYCLWSNAGLQNGEDYL